MEKVDYYSGQPISEFGAKTIDDQMAEQFASFGQYNYGVPTPQVITPGSYNPQYGLGGYNNFQYYNPGMSNPAFGYMNQVGMQPLIQQPQIPQGDVTYDIPGLTFGNDYLPPMGYEELIDKMQMEYWTASINEEAKRDVQSIKQGVQYNAYGQPYYTGYNYYGNPYYYNPYQYNTYSAEFQDKIKEIQEDARERRTKFNINLSRLAQGIVGHHDYDDNAIQEIYRGKTITIPGMTYTDIYEFNRLNTLVPFNNAKYYQEKDAEVSANFHRIIKRSSNMQETFSNMGLVWNEYELEEEKHRRRSRVKEQYDSTSYKYLIKKSAMERYAKEHGIDLPGADQSQDYYTSRFNQIKQQALQNFPTLAATSTLADDGTLHINYVEVNENLNEAQYYQNRDRFNSFLQSIPGVFVDQKGGT